MWKERKISRKILKLSDPGKVMKWRTKSRKVEEELKSHYRSWREAEESEIVNCVVENPRKFYNYFKSRKSVKSRIGPLIDSKGKHTNKKSEMCNILAAQYNRVFSTP